MGCLEGGVLSFLLAKVLARDQHSLFFISGKGVIVWSFVLIAVFSYCMLKAVRCVLAVVIQLANVMSVLD